MRQTPTSEGRPFLKGDTKEYNTGREGGRETRRRIFNHFKLVHFILINLTYSNRDFLSQIRFFKNVGSKDVLGHM